MYLTPAIVRNMYTYLCALPPFSEWDMPDVEGVRFCVKSAKVERGGGFYYGMHDAECVLPVSRKGGKRRLRHTLTVFRKAHADYKSALGTVAHEMCHIHVSSAAFKKYRYDPASHGPAFKKAAAAVCAAHGFDLDTF